MPNNCAAIVIAAKHGELIKVKDHSGIANTVGALRCKFEFRTSDWDNAIMTAVFCKGNMATHPAIVNNAIGVLLDDVDECAVPAEVLTQDAKYFSVGVWGVTVSGLRIVSKWLVFRVEDGCYVDTTEPIEPTPSVYEQILTKIEAIDNHSHENKVVLDGITAEKVTAWDGTEVAAKSHADGLNTAMNTRVEALEAIDHKHANKELLDNYTQTEENLADAVVKKHTHSFSDETALNGITAAKVEAWDVAEQNAKDYADGKVSELADGEVKTNKEAIDAINNETTGILAQAKAYSDSLNYEGTKYTVAADGGLKLDENNAFSIDDSIVWVFDCGDSGVTA